MYDMYLDIQIYSVKKSYSNIDTSQFTYGKGRCIEVSFFTLLPSRTVLLKIVGIEI